MIGKAIFGWVDSLGWFGKILKVVAGIGVVMAAMATFTAVSTALAATIVGGLAAPIVGAAAAAGVLSLGFGLLNTKSVGDLALSPGEGPIVSTAENGIFQGTKNDEVAMFPGAVSMAKGEGGGKGGGMAVPNIDLTPLIAAVNATTEAVKNIKLAVQIDSKQVNNGAMNTSTKAP
jgi:hypothetical protein